MINLLYDCETLYTKDYSLSKMPTAAYVRDARFERYGASVCIPDALPPQWMPEPELRTLMDNIRPVADKVRFIAHHAQFDGLVVSEKDGITFGAYHDTMHQARLAIAQGSLDPNLRTSLSALMPLVGMEKGSTEDAVARLAADRTDAQGAAYAVNDLVATMKLYDTLPPMHPDEAAISELHIRMAVEPRFDLDEALLTAISLEEVTDGAALLRSKENFATALRCLGIEPEMKQGKRGPDYAFAKTDAFMKQLLADEDERVVALAELRLNGCSNIERTRALRMLQNGSPAPIPLLYYGAGTGRTSGADRMNYQNLPTRGGVPRLRRALTAPSGYKVVVVDSSQVEVRVLTWMAKDARTQAVFDAGEDVYRALAAEMYHKPLEAITKDSRERQIAKSARLGLQFGQRPNGFKVYCARSNLYISDAEAHEAVARFDASAPDVVRYWRDVEGRVLRDGALTLPSGRRIVYPDLRRGQRGCEYLPPAIFCKTRAREWEHFWHGLAVNNETQGIARDLVMQQTVRLDRVLRTLGGAVVLSVHDEAVGIVPEDAVRDAEAAALEAFSWVPDWAQGLRVKGEIKVGDNYGVKG